MSSRDESTPDSFAFEDFFGVRDEHPQVAAPAHSASSAETSPPEAGQPQVAAGVPGTSSPGNPSAPTWHRKLTVVVLKLLGFVGILLMYSCYTAAPVGILVSLAPDYEAALDRYLAKVYEREQAIILAEEMGGAGALCRDGWFSPSTGSGTCSWHGGVRKWGHEVRIEAGKPPPAPPTRGWLPRSVYLAGVGVLWLLGLVFVIRAMRSG